MRGQEALFDSKELFPLSFWVDGLGAMVGWAASVNESRRVERLKSVNRSSVSSAEIILLRGSPPKIGGASWTLSLGRAGVVSASSSVHQLLVVVIPQCTPRPQSSAGANGTADQRPRTGKAAPELHAFDLHHLSRYRLLACRRRKCLSANHGLEAQ